MRSFLTLHVFSKFQTPIYKFIVSLLLFPIKGCICFLDTLGLAFTLLNLAIYLAVGTVALTVLLVAYSEVSFP